MTFDHAERKAIPKAVKASIVLRQSGHCVDCGTKLMTGEIIFDHRPPLALREAGADPNDPAKIDAICTACDSKKTPGDISRIAKTKRQYARETEHRIRRDERLPGQKRQRRGTIKGQGFRKRDKTEVRP